MGGCWETWRIPEMCANSETHAGIFQAERQCVPVWPKNNHVGWDSDIAGRRFNCSLNQSLESAFTSAALNQRRRSAAVQFPCSWLIRGCHDKQVSIVRTLDSSCAAFGRSPPWQKTRSGNSSAFSGGRFSSLLWATWGCGWNILRTPKTNPPNWNAHKGRNKGTYLWASGCVSVRSGHW